MANSLARPPFRHSLASSWGPEKWEIDNDAYQNEAITHAGGILPDATATAAVCPLNGAGNKYQCPSAEAAKQALANFDAVVDESYHSAGYSSYTLLDFKSRWNLTDDATTTAAYATAASLSLH